MSDGMERQQAPLARHGRMLMRGGCHCGLLRLAFATSLPAAALAPRACDCSFCHRHGAAWLSDPDGRLDITAAGRNALLSYRQGSEAAEFRLCARCGVLVAATFTDADRLYAAVNAGCLDEAAILPPRFGFPRSRWAASGRSPAGGSCGSPTSNCACQPEA